jgi:hypothetical protein
LENRQAPIPHEAASIHREDLTISQRAPTRQDFGPPGARLTSATLVAFLPTVLSGVALPDRVLIFYWPLPIPMPVSERSFIWEPPEEFNQGQRPGSAVRWLSLRFRQFTAEAPSLIPPNFHQELDKLLGESNVDRPKPRAIGQFLHTWCVAAVAIEGDVEDSDVMSSAFDASLTFLNRIIRAFVARTGNFRTRPIAREEIHALAVWEVRGAKDHALVRRGTLLVNENIPLSPEPVSIDVELAIAITVRDSEPGLQHPFTVYREWLERAKHAHLHEGDYEGAVLFLQTATEAFLRGVFRMTLVDANLGSADIESEVARNESFKALIETGLPFRLGGRWDLSLSSTPVGVYWTDLYELRNRIVHGAIYVTAPDVRQAFAAYGGLRDEVNRLLLARSNRFQRTLLALMGEPGLRKRSRWSKQFEQTKRQIGLEAKPFWWPIDRR